MVAKRKRSAAAATPTVEENPLMDRSHMRRTDVPLPPNVSQPPRRQSTRGAKAAKTDPNVNPDVLDGVTALRASPDGQEESAATAPVGNGTAKELGAVRDATTAPKSKQKKAGAQPVKIQKEDNHAPAVSTGVSGDPDDVDGLEAEEDEGEVKEALSRPPPVNSEYLPLPWKGRLGYVCILQVLFDLN
jgi:UV DNA damage endonuclease